LRNKWLLTIVALLGAGFLGLLALATAQKSIIAAGETVVIQSSGDRVYETINRMSDAGLWLPWLRGDAQPTLTFSGPESEAFDACQWQGDDAVGSGSVSIRESVYIPPEGEHLGQGHLG
jgi:hypothetical protein